jgi:hypothetical protein
VKRENEIDSIRRTIAWFDQYLMGKSASPDEQAAQPTLSAVVSGTCTIGVFRVMGGARYGWQNGLRHRRVPCAPGRIQRRFFPAASVRVLCCVDGQSAIRRSDLLRSRCLKRWASGQEGDFQAESLTAPELSQQSKPAVRGANKLLRERLQSSNFRVDHPGVIA